MPIIKNGGCCAASYSADPSKGNDVVAGTSTVIGVDPISTSPSLSSGEYANTGEAALLSIATVFLLLTPFG